MKRTRTATEVQEDIESKSKICSTCGERKDFYYYNKMKRSKDGHAYNCRPCDNRRQRESLAAHPRPLSVIKAERRMRVCEKYGMTVDDFDELLKKQGGTCAICGKKQKNGRKHENLSIDHCHTTGKVRGLLCRKCNLGLGLFGDTTDGVQKALDYLMIH